MPISEIIQPSSVEYAEKLEKSTFKKCSQISFEMSMANDTKYSEVLNEKDPEGVSIKRESSCLVFDTR